MAVVKHGIDLYGEGDGLEKRALVRDEFSGFFGGSDDPVKDDCAALLNHLKRLSDGREDVAVDARETVDGLRETLYCRACGSIVALYAIDGPEGRVKRVVTVLRVARAQSAQPRVNDLELAKQRLKQWRRQG